MPDPRIAYYLIKDWLAYLGVPRYGANSSHADDANRYVGLQQEHQQNPYVLAHESFHIWLFKAHGIDNEAIRRTYALGGHDKNAFFGPSGGIVKAYFDLCEKAESIVLAESSLPSASKRGLQGIFGPPEEYDFQKASPVSDRMIAAANRGQTFNVLVGNLVDESSIFEKELGTGGHPMHSYHEFFASTVATMMFDGDVFFERLSKLKLAAQSDPNLQDICSDVTFLLRAASRHAAGIPSSIGKSSPNAKKDPNIKNLKANLERLNYALSEEQAQPRVKAPLGRY